MEFAEVVRRRRIVRHFAEARLAVARRVRALGRLGSVAGALTLGGGDTYNPPRPDGDRDGRSTRSGVAQW